MAVLLMAAALLGVGLLVFWVEPLSVLSAIERFAPNIIYRVRTHRLWLRFPSTTAPIRLSRSKS